MSMISQQPPTEYVCPLTKKLISDPVVSRYGNFFERKAILKWLNDGHNYCPVTGNPLRISNIVSDKTLQWKIQYWAKKHNIELDTVGSEEYYYDPPPADNGSTSASAAAASYAHAANISNKGLPLTFSVPEKRFICPLTKELMEDPVMTKTGHNFERDALSKWIDEYVHVLSSWLPLFFLCFFLNLL